jgi:hypothetical protein
MDTPAGLRTFRTKPRLIPASHGTFPGMLPAERNHALYKVSGGLRSTRNEDGGIVLDIERGQIFRLNPVGALVLESLGKGRAETEIAKDITLEYGISEEEAVVDVRDFLQSLERHKLVRPQPGDQVS